MASAKEISKRIGSIRDTMKITKAMYMMSSMKLRKAKEKLDHTEPYFLSLQEQISDILLHYPDMEHLYFDNRSKDRNEKVKTRAFVIVTGDKGLAGAYNHDILKTAMKLIEKEERFRLMVVGEVGRQFFISRGLAIDENFQYTSYNPSIHRARMITEYLIELYLEEEIDEVTFIYTRMINSMNHEVRVDDVLPLKTHSFIKKELLEQAERNMGKQTKGMAESADEWFFIYPSPRQVLEKLVYSYITGFVYGVLVEGTANEENARMQAMQAATDNAKAMLKELSVEYNRVRQAMITQEITEIVGGAKALRRKKKKMKG